MTNRSPFSTRPRRTCHCGLPAKLKERWNALYDPTGTAALNKKYKKALGAKGQSKDPKVEEAKAKRAEAVAAAPAAPFKSALQSELFALMDTYKDVTYTARAPPGHDAEGTG